MSIHGNNVATQELSFMDQLFGQQGTYNASTKQFEGGFDGFAMPALNTLGSLADAWGALQQVSLGEDRLAFDKDVFNKNYTNQLTTTNNSIDQWNDFARRAGGANAFQLNSVGQQAQQQPQQQQVAPPATTTFQSIPLDRRV